MSLDPQINDLEDTIADLRAELSLVYERIRRLEAELDEVAEMADV